MQNNKSKPHKSPNPSGCISPNIHKMPIELLTDYLKGKWKKENKPLDVKDNVIY